MPSDIKAGIVLVNAFTTGGADSYNAYIDYIDRNEATRNAHYNEFVIKDLKKNGTNHNNANENSADYIGYMDNPEKTGGIFTASQDSLTSEQKKALKAAFRKAQSNKSIMWQSILSFDNRWLDKYGIYDPSTHSLNEEKIRQVTRLCVTKMQKEENLGNAIWSASIHYNTDNIHVHVAMVEPIPMRQKKTVKSLTFSAQWLQNKGILKLDENTHLDTGRRITETKGNYQQMYRAICSALQDDNYYLRLGRYIHINADKSISISYLDNTDDALPDYATLTSQTEYKGSFKKKTLEAGKRVIVNEIVHQEESLKEITDLLRTITAGNNARRIQNADKKIATLYWDLYNELPKDTALWNYNGAAMQPYREKIDEITNLYIEHYHKDDFSNIIRKLDAVDSIYGEAYGKQSNYKDNKLQDLHVRFGNRILKEMKASSSIFKRSYHRSYHPAAENRDVMRDLHSSIYFLKRALNDEYSSYKNQLRYEELEREAEENVDY